MYLVFDIGATKIRLAKSLDAKTIEKPEIVATPVKFDEGIEVFRKFIGDRKILAAGGGIAGPLNRKKSMMINPPNLGAWAKKPLRQSLKNVLKCPVFLENDAALAGLGEAIRGAGKDFKIVAYMTISTGVGGVKIGDGKLDENAMGFEPGHQIIDKSSQLICGCGGRGHLEAFVGGASLEKRFNKLAQDLDNLEIWDEVSKNLAIGLNNTIVHWSPEVVVLGGSLMNKISVEKVHSYLRNYLKIFPTLPVIKKATLGEASALYGALTLLQDDKK